MYKIIIFLTVSMFMMTGCGESDVVIETPEDYKVVASEVEYEAKAVPIKKEVFKIDETMNVLVNNGDQVTPETVVYEVVDNKAKQQLNTYKFELGIDKEDLNKLNEKLNNTPIEDPSYESIKDQRDNLDKKIKLSEHNLNNTAIENKVYAKFNGKVFIDNQTGDVIITSNEYGVELNATFDTLKEVMDKQLYLVVDGTQYNVSYQNYIPAAASTEGTSAGYKIFYKIDDFKHNLIDSQPLGLKRTTNEIFVPIIYLTDIEGVKYLKVNGETKVVEGEDVGGKLKISSGVNINDVISVIGEDDDIFKKN